MSIFNRKRVVDADRERIKRAEDSAATYLVQNQFARLRADVLHELESMQAPRYDWNQTAEGIIKRLNSIEVQLTKIRMKQEEHEQTFVTLGAKLRT